MTSIAVIGLGIMGRPMAVNLARAGHDVTGMNRSPARLAPLVAAGGRAADSVADAVADAEVVITMLPDSPDVEAVALGTDGVLARAPRGALYIDMSTIAPQTAIRLAGAGVERGIRVLDAPVSGGEAAAIEGTLSVMVGGAEADVEAARPVLETVGATVVRVGGAGAGQTVKAANQLIVAAVIQVVSESIVFLRGHDVDLDAAVEVLRGGLAGNRVLDRKGASMLAGSFEPGFRLDLHRKDLGILLAAAREERMPLPVGALVAQLVESMVANGDGGLDHSALLLGVERLAGRA